MFKSLNEPSGNPRPPPDVIVNNTIAQAVAFDPEGNSHFHYYDMTKIDNYNRREYYVKQSF